MNPGQPTTAAKAPRPRRAVRPSSGARPVSIRVVFSYVIVLTGALSLPACLEVPLTICDPCPAMPTARPTSMPTSQPTVTPPPPPDVVERDAWWRRDSSVDVVEASVRPDVPLVDVAPSDVVPVYDRCPDLSRFYEDELRYDPRGFGTRCVEPALPSLPVRGCALVEAEPAGVECASVLARDPMLDEDGLPTFYRDSTGVLRVLCTVRKTDPTEAVDAPAGWFAFADPQSLSCGEGIRFTPRGTPRHNAYLFLRCCDR